MEIKDVEQAQIELEQELENLIEDYKLKDSDCAWILFQIATKYYFRDICGRKINIKP